MAPRVALGLSSGRLSGQAASFFLTTGALRPPRQIRVALCLVTSAIFICGVEYFAPSHSECVFRCFELPLLLLQTSCSGDEPFMRIHMLW